MLWFLSFFFLKAIDNIDQEILSSKVNLYRTFTGYKERCLVDGFPSCISSLLAPFYLLCTSTICQTAPFFFFSSVFFFRDNEIISMTQEKRRGEEPSLPFTPVPLAVLNNDGNQHLLHSL